MQLLIEAWQENLRTLVSQSLNIAAALTVALLLIMLTRYLARWTRRFMSLGVSRTIESPSLRSLLVQSSYVTVWILGILAICVVVFPDLRLGDIVGLLGLSSVAVGFAFQDIFKNFLAGILLLLHEPFQIGDQIRVGDFEGTVDEIAIRSTQIHTYQGERIVIPNSIIFTSEVQVRTALPYRRTDLAIGVDYNTPLPLAVQVLQQAVEGVTAVLTDPAVEIDIVGFGDSSIDLIARYWTPPTQAQVRRAQTQVMIALKQACDKNDINIPYPIRTVYWFDQEKFEDYIPAHSLQPNSNISVSAQV